MIKIMIKNERIKNMDDKLQLIKNRSLKLTNVLIRRFSMDESTDFKTAVLSMDNYIKSKAAQPIGPLIQKMKSRINENGELEIEVYLLRQVNNYINRVEQPFSMESVIRVPNCIYVRFKGPEEKIKFAYDKINVTAFEEDIQLSDENYTIFVDQQDDNIVADVFIQKKVNNE